MRRLMLAAFVLTSAPLAMLALPSFSEAKGGTVLWQDEFAIVEIAAADGRVAAAGTIPNGAGGRTSIVRVYDAEKGKLLWQDPAPADTVIIDGSRVVVAGGTTVRAYDAKKGKLEWQDTAPFAVTQLYRDDDTTIATAVSDDGNSIRVRAYHTTPGTLLVQDQTLPVVGVPFRTLTTFGGGKMFTASVGEGDFDDFPIHPCKVTARSIATGEVLWETTQPFAPPPPTTSNCVPLTVTADRHHVVLGGGGHFHDEFMAQSYDAQTGAFLWEHLSGIGTCCFDAVVTIDTETGLVFLGGWTQNPFFLGGRQDFVVRAVTADTGALRWEARTPGADCPFPSVCQQHAKLVVADSATLYAAGFHGDTGASIPGTGFLRAYERKSGDLRWQNDVDVEAIAATSGTVVILTPGTTSENVILRAYNGK